MIAFSDWLLANDDGPVIARQYTGSWVEQGRANRPGVDGDRGTGPGSVS